MVDMSCLIFRVHRLVIVILGPISATYSEGQPVDQKNNIKYSGEEIKI